MAETRTIPVVELTGETARQHLIVLLERLVYILHRISASPGLLIEGQHHENLTNALSSFDGRLTRAEGWQTFLVPPPLVPPPVEQPDGQVDPATALELKPIKVPRPPTPDPLESALEKHGLSGAELRFKLDTFDQLFAMFLERISLAQDWNQHLNARIAVLEQEAALQKIKELPKVTRETLEFGSSVAQSVGAAFPPAGALIQGVQELVGGVKALVAWWKD